MRRFQVLVLLLITAILLGACESGSGSAAPSTSGDSPKGPSAMPVDSATADGGTAVSAGATQRVTISFAASEDERPLYEPLIARFEAENPGIRVQLVNIDQAATTVTLPDGGQMTSIGPESIRAVVSLADTAVGIDPTPDAIAKGWVRDLAPLIDADPTFDRTDFYPGTLPPDQSGPIYVLPTKQYIDLLAYNKDLWAKRGLPPPKPNWSWSDLKAAAEQLAQKRGDTIEVYGMVDWELGLPGLQAELTESGFRPDPAAPLRLDDPAVVAALERVVALARSGTYSGDGDFRQRILDQQVGIWPATPNMLAAEPGSNALHPNFAIGTMPRPIGFGGVLGYLMSGGSAHPVEAWRWLSFLSHQVIGEPYWNANPASVVPARKSVAERSGYWKQLDPEATAAVKAVLDRPARVAQMPDFGLNAGVQLRVALSAAIHGEKTPAAALHEAQVELERQLAQAPPTPTPATGLIVVDTPVPAAPVEAARVTFGALRPVVDQMRQLARKFNQQNPAIFVEIKTFDPFGGPLRLADVAAQTDCFSGFSPPRPTETQAMLDLQPLIDSDPAFPRDDYPAALLAPFTRAGKLYGLPHTVDFRVLNYNQTAFDAAGIPHPSAAWTLDDFLAAAQHLTSGGGNDRRYGFASTFLQAQDVFFFLDRFGAPATTGGGATLQPNFTAPKVVQAIRTYLDLLRTSSPHQRLTGYIRNEFQNQVVELVNAGRVGMWFDFGSNFLNLGPDATQDYTRAIAPPPLGTSAATANDFRVSGLYISARAQQPEACWAWLKYLGVQPMAPGGNFPARRSVAESDAFIKQALPGAAEVYKAYSAALERAPADNSAQADRSDIDYYWFLRAVDRGLQGQDLERELADAQSITEQYLACVRGGARGSDCAKQVDADYRGWQNTTLPPPGP
ncbi:MAG TPA: extracellular solute-binding protein [Roseiflexaceae bacterium]